MTYQEQNQAREAVGRLADEGIDVVRVVYPDFFGLDRGRDIPVESLPHVMNHGLAFCRAVFHTTLLGDVTPVDGPRSFGTELYCRSGAATRPHADLTPSPRRASLRGSYGSERSDRRHVRG